MEGLDHVLAAGQANADPKAVPGGVIPYAVVPEGAGLEELERLLPAPVRTRASVVAHDAATFNAYFNRFKTSGSAIFGDQANFRLIGIIDYPGATAPAWAQHRITYTAPRSLEWERWMGANGKRMGQADFALFVEDNVVDIRSPPGADVLEIARGLQAKKSVEFVSAIRLADGEQQFTYNETINGSAAKGTMSVPDEFTLGIPVFFGGELYEVRARLRYRIESGKLAMWFDLYRPEYINRDAFEKVCADVAAKTATELWQGSP